MKVSCIISRIFLPFGNEQTFTYQIYIITTVFIHGNAGATDLLCTNTTDLKNHLLTAFNYKRSYLQQDKKDETFEYIYDILNGIAGETNRDVYNHTFEKIYAGEKVNTPYF